MKFGLDNNHVVQYFAYAHHGPGLLLLHNRIYSGATRQVQQWPLKLLEDLQQQSEINRLVWHPA